jgi:hypothetical protein
MDRLDRLGWAVGIAVEAHGVRVGIRVTDPSAMDEVVETLPPGWRPVAEPRVDHLFSLVMGGRANARGSVRRLHLLYRDGVRLARDRDIEPVLESLQTELRRTVAEFAPHRMFLHAGVVGWGGRAILVPGRTFTGKTTLVGQLVRAGAVYYSDEYAPLDDRGWVHPFPTPLSVRDGSHRGRDLSPESFGATSGTDPIPVGMVVVTEYRPGATWRPRRGSAGEGALALLANAVSARSRPEQVMGALSALLPGALVLSGRRGDAESAAPVILRSAQRWLESPGPLQLQGAGRHVDSMRSAS